MQTIVKDEIKLYYSFIYFISLFFIIFMNLLSPFLLISASIGIQNNILYVNNSPFIIRGVCYQSIPVGKNPSEYNYEIYPYSYENDFKLIKEMGANCIRTYTDFKYQEIMDKAFSYGLYVIMQYQIPYNTSFTSYTTRTQILNGVKNMVNRWKAHPALLMWTIGNEVSFNILNLTNSGKTNLLQSWYKFLNEIASNIHVWESPYWHPVSTTEAVGSSTNFGPHKGIEIIGNKQFFADDDSLKFLDVWGIQTYQGKGFTPGFFDRYKELTKKPLWISETGCDAYDILSGSENQAKQKEYIQSQWEEIKNHLSINSSYPCIGVTFFEWADEWWKYSGGFPSIHDTNGSWQNPFYYDYQPGLNNMNEEWWGLVAIFPDTFKRYPREAYYYIKSVWNSDRTNYILNDFLLKSEPVALPNPVDFSQRDEVEIYVYLNSESKVECKIFDYSGRLIRKLSSPYLFAGYTYLFRWNGKDLYDNRVKSGIYLCKITAVENIEDSAHKIERIIKIMVKR